MAENTVQTKTVTLRDKSGNILKVPVTSLDGSCGTLQTRDIEPLEADAYNLGSPTGRWRNVYSYDLNSSKYISMIDTSSHRNGWTGAAAVNMITADSTNSGYNMLAGVIAKSPSTVFGYYSHGVYQRLYNLYYQSLARLNTQGQTEDVSNNPLRGITLLSPDGLTILNRLRISTSYVASSGQNWLSAWGSENTVLSVDGNVQVGSLKATSHSYIGDYRVLTEKDLEDYNINVLALQLQIYGTEEGEPGVFMQPVKGLIEITQEHEDQIYAISDEVLGIQESQRGKACVDDLFWNPEAVAIPIEYTDSQGKWNAFRYIFEGEDPYDYKGLFIKFINTDTEEVTYARINNVNGPTEESSYQEVGGDMTRDVLSQEMVENALFQNEMYRVLYGEQSVSSGGQFVYSENSVLWKLTRQLNNCDNFKNLFPSLDFTLDHDITTDTFLTVLENHKAFADWGAICWKIELNDRTSRNITDTSCGNICLSGALLEISGTDRNNCTIKITTAGRSRDNCYDNGTFVYTAVSDGASVQQAGWKRLAEIINDNLVVDSISLGTRIFISSAGGLYIGTFDHPEGSIVAHTIYNDTLRTNNIKFGTSLILGTSIRIETNEETESLILGTVEADKVNTNHVNTKHICDTLVNNYNTILLPHKTPIDICSLARDAAHSGIQTSHRASFGYNDNLPNINAPIKEIYNKFDVYSEEYTYRAARDYLREGLCMPYLINCIFLIGTSSLGLKIIEFDSNRTFTPDTNLPIYNYCLHHLIPNDVKNIIIKPWNTETLIAVGGNNYSLYTLSLPVCFISFMNNPIMTLYITIINSPHDLYYNIYKYGSFETPILSSGGSDLCVHFSVTSSTTLLRTYEYSIRPDLSIHNTILFNKSSIGIIDWDSTDSRIPGLNLYYLFLYCSISGNSGLTSTSNHAFTNKLFNDTFYNTKLITSPSQLLPLNKFFAEDLLDILFSRQLDSSYLRSSIPLNMLSEKIVLVPPSSNNSVTVLKVIPGPNGSRIISEA